MYFDWFARRWVQAPDGVPSGGQEPASDSGTQPVMPQVVPAVTPAAPAETPSEKEISKLNAEAAKWRVQFKETQAALVALQAQAGDNKALSDQLAKLQADLAAKATEAEQAQKLAQVIRLAVKAGVDPDLIAMLDLSKIDVTDEKKALEALSKFAGAGKGAQVRPGAITSNGDTEQELRNRYFSGAPRSTLFGG